VGGERGAGFSLPCPHSCRHFCVATDDKSAINACKLVTVPFTTALGVLTRLNEKGALDREEALLKIAILEREGRYKKSIVAAVRSRLEVSRWEEQ